MIDIAKALNYYDNSNRKILWPKDVPAEKSDQYNEMLSSYQYLRIEIGWEIVGKEYGESIAPFQNKDVFSWESYSRESDVDLGEYTRLATNKKMKTAIKKGKVVATYNGKEVLCEPLRCAFDKSSGKIVFRESDYVYSNDSCKLVISEFAVYNKTVQIDNCDGLFFR